MSKVSSSIDLGTNTCLLLIAEISETGEVLRVIEDHSTVVRLGQGIDQNRFFLPEAMERTLTCLSFYAERVQSLGLDPKATLAVGTSQARDSSNAAEFFKKISLELGFNFQILSGEQEARATFLGALLPGMSANAHAVIDIGGGSTELQTETQGLSLDIGAVRFTERYFKTDPVKDDEFWLARRMIDEGLQKASFSQDTFTGKKLLAVAGTATTLGSWFLNLEKFDASKLDGLSPSRGDIHRMVEDLKWMSNAEKRELIGVDPKRADVLLAGALILWRTLEFLNKKTVTISTRGLRFGVFKL